MSDEMKAREELANSLNEIRRHASAAREWKAKANEAFDRGDFEKATEYMAKSKYCMALANQA